MSIQNCPRCGRKVSDRAPACPGCGADPKQPPEQPLQSSPDVEPQADRLDCRECGGVGTMDRARLKRFPVAARILGYILVIPSTLWVLFGLAVSLSTCTAGVHASKMMATSAERAGVGLGILVGQYVALGFIVPPLIVGLLGSLLLLRRKVWRCERCGYVFERT